MAKRTVKTKNQGFTLLETVVVLAMIAILTGIAVSTLRFDRGEQSLDDRVQAIVALYRGARDEAILMGAPRRLIRRGDVLVVEKRKTRGEIDYIDDENLTVFELESALAMTVRITPKTPIYFFPNGQATPFKMTLTLVDSPTISRQIHGDAMGRIRIQTLTEAP